MLPNIEILEMIKIGFQFLKGIVTDIQLRNLMLIATATILQGQFNLSHASRTWLKERSANAFSHCLKRAKINFREALIALAMRQQQAYDLGEGRFIIDDTLEHHSRFCKFIHAVFRHWDHVFHTNAKGICIVFLYYSQGNWIKFPIGWRIYLKERGKTKHDLAIELIKEALGRGFPCRVVLGDSWFCIRPFISQLQKLGLSYTLEIKTNANIRVPLKEVIIKRRGRKRKKWYNTVNIKEYMKWAKGIRKIGFKGDIDTGKPEKKLYIIKERVCMIHALPGKHKVIYSYDEEKKTRKYLITNELTWEGVKVVKEYFCRWVIEEFFRNAKQQLNMEGACVRSEQGVAIKLLLVTCIDSLIHMKIAKLVSANSKSGAITFQSVIRLAILENAENFVTLIKSPKGEDFLKRWLDQLKKDAIRKRKVKSEVGYLDQHINEGLKNVA
jgi:hypothetical protein